MDAMTTRQKTVAIIGAGPVGLAAAAHALERGLTPVVLEAGAEIGHAVRQWGHVRMFSPWEYNIDRAAERLLASSGWNSPDPHGCPTGAELVERYLEPLAARTALKEHIQTLSRVTAISRVGYDKVRTKGREQAQFELRYQNGAGPKTILADAAIDASGSWSSPNAAGANGLEAIGEALVQQRIAYGMPDVSGRQRSRYAGKTVAVLGSGHSAIGTLIELDHLRKEAPDTRVLWLLRGDPRKALGGGANDKLTARGQLGVVLARVVAEGLLEVETGFQLKHLSIQGNRLRVSSGTESCGRAVVVDELIVATGFRPDLSFLRELRIAIDPALECPPMLAPLIDPNEHSCGTVRPHGARELAQPEHGFYIAGMKSYGRAPTFLMRTGYEQIRSIMAEIDGDRAAAEGVDLVLPETGVCSLSPAGIKQSGCGGGRAETTEASACQANAEAKAKGAAGCG
jgi:thioredoxin reductase